MKKFCICLFTLSIVILLSGCNEIPVVDSDILPSTENAVFTDNGSLFVVGKNILYEITKNPDNTFGAEVIFDCETDFNKCSFGGLTVDGNVLYASCSVADPTETEDSIETSTIDMNAIKKAEENNLDLVDIIMTLFGFTPPASTWLYRIDTTEEGTTEINKAPIYADNEVFYGNGMAVDETGAVYITNSHALLKKEPAIIRITIENNDPFIIKKQSWLQESYGIYPNGIQIEENTVYYTSGNKLYKMIINEDDQRSAGNLHLLYTPPILNLIDDFAILPDELVATQFPLMSLLSPDAAGGSKLITLSKPDDLVQGDVRNRIHLKNGFIPSSVAYVKGEIFEQDAIFVTSFFNGALYKFTDY